MKNKTHIIEGVATCLVLLGAILATLGIIESIPIPGVIGVLILGVLMWRVVLHRMKTPETQMWVALFSIVLITMGIVGALSLILVELGVVGAALPVIPDGLVIGLVILVVGLVIHGIVD